ncbi:MAG: hypothetical protein J5985_03945, partial [Kiritimatiellae bacterium]|nr:hypothetical protein [Kiritimatiellia bacterium]
LPSIAAMHAEPPAVASAYMKAVADFQKEYAKYLMRGKFVDDEGFACRTGSQPVQGGDANALAARSTRSVVAKRFVADDGTSAVCVWTIAGKPADIVIDGLGKPKGVFVPPGEKADGPLVADAIRLYVYP